MQNNSIVGVFGKKGSGKSTLVKKCLQNMNRYIVVDPMHEYTGVICYSWHDVADVLKDFKAFNFKIVYRSPNDTDMDNFFALINTRNRETHRFELTDFSLVFEEVDLHCSPYYVHDGIKYLTRYGRHSGRSFLYVSRRPAAVNRDMTSQTDLMISFKQVEPNDLKYFANFTFNKPLETLQEYEYAWNGDADLFTMYLGIEYDKGGDKPEIKEI